MEKTAQKIELLEVLRVVAAIAILVGVVIIAMNMDDENITEQCHYYPSVKRFDPLLARCTENHE